MANSYDWNKLYGKKEGYGFSGFSPLALSNLVWWIDALDEKTISKSSNLVSVWADKSISAANAFQVLVARQVAYQATGVNGLPALYSNGVDNMGMGFVHPIAVGDDYTMFIVCKGDTDTVDPTAGSGLNAVISGSEAVNSDEYIGISQTRDSVDGTNHNLLRTIGSAQGFTNALSGADVITMAFDQSFLDSYLGTTLEEHGSATTSTQVITNGHIFRDDISSRSFVGWIQEVIIYKRFLSAAEILEVQQYLISKWSL